MAYTNLSAEEIQRQLEEIEQNRTELERALTARRQEEKQNVVQQIRDLITSNGYELDEIASMLTTRRRRGGAPAAAVVPLRDATTPALSTRKIRRISMSAGSCRVG